MTHTEIQDLQNAIASCFVGCTESIEDKKKAFIASMEMFNRWQDEEARAYIAALEADPDFDMSPAAFSTSRNHAISIG